MSRLPLVLCSGSLGSAPLPDKFAAAASAGFDGVSVYGGEVRAALDAGHDLRGLSVEHGVFVAEVDGVVQQLRSDTGFDEALAIAELLGARSITVVEVGDYDPSDPAHVATAIDVFGSMCDRAAVHEVIVHIEPFSWSPLGRLADAAVIVQGAGRANGGLLLDLWHHVRGPDQGVLDPAVDVGMIRGLQLADTVAEPWSNVRDECMTRRLLPGDGAGDLVRRLGELGRDALPPVGVEVFGHVLAGRPPAEAARMCFDALQAVVEAAATGGPDDL